jgi:hypothetical protein
MRLLTLSLQGRALSAACLLCACSSRAEEAVAVSLKISETFYGLLAHTDPQKVACAHNSLRTSAKASANVG